MVRVRRNGRTINTGAGWTLLAVECFLRESCKDCVYNRYCRPEHHKNKPVLKEVCNVLLETVGQPPERMINKVTGKDLFADDDFE
jgi:hypothetical protein